MVFTINTPDSGPGSWTDFQQAAIHGTSAGTAPAAGGSSSTTASSTASATGTASATPAIHTVTVGGGGNLKYTPNIVQANPKDIVVFSSLFPFLESGTANL
jgi:threonine/homoserine/homoserine lactone efflux protein